MGRRKTNSVQFKCQIGTELLDQLKSVNPSLLTVEPGSGRIKFRHGALSRYVSRLIRQDIYARQQLKDKTVGEIVDEISNIPSAGSGEVHNPYLTVMLQSGGGKADLSQKGEGSSNETGCLPNEEEE